MVRPLRIEFPGAVYHVIARGNEKKEYFLFEEEKLQLFSLLRRLHDRYNFIFYAYCVMDNHYHLLLETPDGNLSRGMHNLNGIFAQRYNEKHERNGHLFQGRYKAFLVQKESYLLAVSRYIVLNPVRANACSHPAAYRWSSYRATAGAEPPPGFLRVDAILAEFSEEKRVAQEEYSRFVLAGIGLEAPRAYKNSMILGDKDFVERMNERLKEKEKVREVPRKERLVNRPALSEIFAADGDIYVKEARNLKIAASVLEYGYSQSEVAKHLGLHYSTVSLVVKRATGS